MISRTEKTRLIGCCFLALGFYPSAGVVGHKHNLVSVSFSLDSAKNGAGGEGETGNTE